MEMFWTALVFFCAGVGVTAYRLRAGRSMLETGRAIINGAGGPGEESIK
jgi:hypothetical protein